MTFKIITTALAICCTMQLAAQSSKVKTKARVSVEREVQDNLVPKAAVSTNEGRTVLVFKPRDPLVNEKTAAKATPMFELHDPAKLTLIRTLEIPDNFGKQKVVLEDVITFQGDPVLFGTVRNFATGDISVVYTKVDPNITRGSRPFEALATFNAGISGEHVIMGRRPGRLDPLFVTTPDTKTMLVVSPEVRDTVAGRGIFLITLVSDLNEPQWQHVVEVEEGLDRAELIDARVDPDGNAWLLIRYDHKGRKAAKGEVESEVKLFHVGADGIRGIRFGLERSQYVKSAIFDQDEKGAIRVAGLASTTADGVKPVMIFLADIPKEANDLAEPRMFKDPFSFTGKNVVMRDMLRNSKGDIHLIMEEYEYASIPHPKTLIRSMKHVHGPIHILQVGSSGAPKWNSTLKRLAHSESDLFGDIHPLLFDDQLQLFMIDSDALAEKRKDSSKDMVPSDLDKPYTVHLMFNEKGEYDPKKIIDTGYKPTLIAGRDLYPIGGDRYFGFGASKFEGNGYLPVNIEFSR